MLKLCFYEYWAIAEKIAIPQRGGRISRGFFGEILSWISRAFQQKSVFSRNDPHICPKSHFLVFLYCGFLGKICNIASGIPAFFICSTDILYDGRAQNIWNIYGNTVHDCYIHQILLLTLIWQVQDALILPPFKRYCFEYL